MLLAIWTILGQLSPWLLLGMAISGLLELLLPQNFIRRRFKGFSGVIQAVAIGIPLPLCSCGVIPAGIGLKNQGADDGASIGFVISTPQTGVDSILVSMSFFGWPFALFKMFAALVLGVIGGVIANTEFVRDRARLNVSTGGHQHSHHDSKPWKKFLWHCFDIFNSIWFWLVIGVVVSAAIEVWVPQAWIAQVGELGALPAMLIVLLISVPMYICATASVPLAAALVAAGFPYSAALVFLMAGPATNTTTIGAVYSKFGAKVLVVYLSVIVIGSMLSGLVFEGILQAGSELASGDGHHHVAGWISNLSSLVVLILILVSVFLSIRSKMRAKQLNEI